MYKLRSLTDSLTGLSNRRHMEEVVEEWLQTKEAFSLILIDIDHFKQGNDTFGHQKGDEVLIFLANQIKELTSENDFYARLGGEEFVILTPQKEEVEPLNIANNLQKATAYTTSPTGTTITFSAGVGVYMDKQEAIGNFLNRVDNALYEAKRQGRNQVVLAKQH